MPLARVLLTLTDLQEGMYISITGFIRV